MIIKRTLLAGLLGCTVLAGCNSDEKADANAEGTGTFATDVEALKRTNAALVANLDKKSEKEQLDKLAADFNPTGTTDFGRQLDRRPAG